MTTVDSLFEAESLFEGTLDTPIATIETARETGQIEELSRDHAGELVFTVFADSKLLFGFRGLLSVSDPCPRCVLFHLASDAEQVSVLQEEVTETPSLGDVARETVHELVGRAAREGPEPVLVVHDHDCGSWFSSTSVHKHPLCSHDGFSPRSKTDHRQVADAEDLEEVFLDPHFGIIRRADDVRDSTTHDLFETFSDFYITQTRALNPAYYLFPDRYQRFVAAGGSGRTPEIARIRGLMEGIERFGMNIPRPLERVAAESDLDERHVSFRSFYMFDDAWTDISQARYDTTTPCEWVSTRELKTRESVYVPADLVYMMPSKETQHRFIYGNSSGCAAHFDLREALVGGITELFERDATMHHWYTWSSEPQVCLSTLPDPYRTSVSSLESMGYDVHVVDATRYEPFYCFEVFLLDPDREDLPPVVPAQACALDTESALERAIREALDILLVAATRDRTPIESKEDVVYTEDHFDFYQRDGRHRYLDSLLEPAETVSFRRRSTKTALSSLIDATKKHDVTVYWRELTPPALRRHGVHVVRTVSPDLVPITFGHGRERLDHPSDPVSDNRPDDIPHPYP